MSESSKTVDALPTRCQPGLAPELRDLFPQEVVQVLDTAGLNKLMNFKLDGLGSRIVFVDCCKGNQLDAEKSGRINLYDEKMLIALVSQRGKKQNQYSKTAKPLCSFEFEKWEESPYKQFELHQDDLVTLYKKRVLDRTRDEIVVDIGPYCIPESTFVDCLKKRQYLLNRSTFGGQELESDRAKDASERHDIDISLYEKVTPEVKAQQNNCDCGFHVLLYVRGFDEKDIYNIDKEKVKLLRMELTKFLLHHPENRKNPKRRRISVHEDIPDEEEECELLGKSEEATLNSNSSGSSLGESFGFGASKGTGQEDSDENSSAESLPGHNSPNAVKNKGVPKGKKRGWHDGNDDPVFSVGQTSIKAGELLKFLEADNYDLRILNAFIHCLKCDDKDQGYSEQRIIIPAQDLNDDKFADVIKKELQELKNGAFRFYKTRSLSFNPATQN
ncbi:hypothetical protein ZWY2020_047626 [Hordeum vulgare]|nr:hypothetical protein ZWY2020_047626 [Hordeum vulgare]